MPRMGGAQVRVHAHLLPLVEVGKAVTIKRKDSMLAKILGGLILLAIIVGVVWLLIMIIPIVLPIVATIAAVAYGVWLCNGPSGK